MAEKLNPKEVVTIKGPAAVRATFFPSRIMRRTFRIVTVLLLLVYSSCATIDSLEPEGGGRTYDVPYGTAYRIVLDTLEELDFVIKREDSSKGEIRAQTDQYWKGIWVCHGNLIGVFLVPVGPSQTKVEIQSKYVIATEDLGCKDKAQQLASKMSLKMRRVPTTPTAFSPPLSSVTSPPSIRQEMLQGRFKELADQLSSGIKEHHVARLAILPLADATQKTNTPLGNYLTEKITNELFKTASVKVIERSQLARVIDELHLTMTGTFDDASVKRIGRILGVDAVIMGAYAELGTDTVEVNTRIITVETAEVVGVGTIQIPRASVEKLVR